MKPPISASTRMREYSRSKAQEDQGGESEDDAARHRLAGRARGLDDVVFEDGGAAEGPQHRDGEHRDGDGGADGETRAQADVDRHRSEDDAEQHSDDERPGRELRDIRFIGNVGLECLGFGCGVRHETSWYGVWGEGSTMDFLIRGGAYAENRRPGRFGEEGLKVHTFKANTMKTRLLLVLGLLAFSSVARAQLSQFTPEYLENLYGPVRDVGLDDLGFNPETYSGRAVRVKGRSRDSGHVGNHLGDGRGGNARDHHPHPPGHERRPVEEPQRADDRGDGSVHQDLGTERGTAGAVAGTMGVIQFWTWAGPPEKLGKDPKAAIMTLEQLVSREGKMDGQLVRVVGSSAAGICSATCPPAPCVGSRTG